MATETERFQCNVCHKLFKSIDKLVKHKSEAVDHDYCPHCNLDFGSFDELKDHKAIKSGEEINALREWEKLDAIQRHIQSKMYGEDMTVSQAQPRLRHLCCKFCGMDFVSIGGRDAHIKQHHPLSQTDSGPQHHSSRYIVNCPGCKEGFSSAHDMIHHLETGLCTKISEDVFMSCLTHKEIVKQLIQNPERLAELSALDYTSAAADNTSGGGVALDAALEDIGLQAPLKPEQSRPDNRLDISPFPRLRTSQVKQDTAPANDLARLQTLMTDVTLQSSCKSVLLPSAPRKLQIQRMQPPEALSPVSTSGKAYVTDAPNPIEHQFWNPLSTHFTPERFYNPVIEMYQCPFLACDHRSFVRNIFSGHLITAHRPINTPCPACNRRFPTRAGLIAHFEAPLNTKCRIRNAHSFAEKVDEYSGGFLRAFVEERPDVSREADGSTMLHVRFEGVRPQGLVTFEVQEGMERDRVRVVRKIGGANGDDGGDGW